MDNNYNIERIREMDITELIGADIELKMKGSVLMGCCPFHGGGSERTPSLAVYQDEGRFHCYGGGCGKSGTHIDYVLFKNNLPNDAEGISKAVDILCDFYSIQKREVMPSGDGPVLISNKKKARIYIQNYLREALKSNEPITEYLDGRGVYEADREYFGVGCGTGTMLKDLKSKISLRTLVEIGVIRELADKDTEEVKHFDYIKKGMITVPVKDERGEISHWWLRDINNKNDKQWYGK